MALERIKVEGLSNAPTFTQVVKHGNVAYISGQTAAGPDGVTVGKGDVVAQADQVLTNLGIALKSVGADYSKVIKLTIYVTDARFREPVAAARAKFFPENPPAATFVVCTGLAIPDYLVEIEAIAALD